MISVREINDIEELAGERPTWHSLHAQTEGASFFQTLQWLEIYWKHYGAGQRLRTLFVSSDGQPVGILPLVVRREKTKVGRLRVLTYPLHDWGSFYGPLGPNPDATLTAGMQHIRQSRRDWDIVELRWIGTNFEQVEQAMQQVGFQASGGVRGSTAFIDLTGTWDDYLAGRTSKWRNNTRRHKRRIAQRGEVGYERYRPRGESYGESDPRWDLYDACEQIAGKSWQGSSTTGTTLSHASVKPFLRQCHAAAARLGMLDLNYLSLDGKPLAFVYNYHCRGSVYGLRVGYDAALSRDGVGNLAYVYTIEDSYKRGDHTYDMGPGSLDCKRQLNTKVVDILKCSHFHPTAPRAQLVRLKRWVQRRIADESQLASAKKPSSKSCLHAA